MGRLPPPVPPRAPSETPPKSSISLRLASQAGLGCAMSNAKPEVKQAADVTLRWSNAEDGVARQCEKLRAEGRLRPRR